MIKHLKLGNHLFFWLMILNISCSHQKKNEITDEAASREIANVNKIFMSAAVKTGIFDDMLKLQLDDLLRAESTVSKIKGIGSNKSADFVLKGANSGSKVSFVKNPSGEFKLILTNSKGIKTTIADNIKFNFELSESERKTADIKYTSIVNGKEVVVYTRPGTSGSAELVRLTDIEIAKGKNPWANKTTSSKPEYERSPAFKEVDAVLAIDGYSEADKKIRRLLLELGFPALLASRCKSLGEMEKKTIAYILENLAAGKENPQSFRALVESYQVALKIGDPNVSEQLVRILLQIECGFNPDVFPDV